MKKPDSAAFGAEPVELRFSYELRETSRLLLDVLKKSLAPHDITLTQYFLLRQVWGFEGISQSVLSERLGTTQPATVATVDSLEKRGLIKRVRSTRDRRVVRLLITPRGLKMRDLLLGYAHEKSVVALAGLRPAEITKLRSLLGRVRANLEDERYAPPVEDERGA